MMDEYFEAVKVFEKAKAHQQKLLNKLINNHKCGIVEYEPTENDVMVTQYLRPNGEKRIMYAPIGKEYVKKSQNMICSAEELRIGQIVIYVRWADQPEEEELLEFATNGPGDNSPNEMLKKMIDKLWDKENIG
jgi:hypothetical protein